MRRILPATLLCLLVACGWQLRDAQVVAEDIGSLHITARDKYSALVTELSRALVSNGVTLVSEQAEANYSVVIVDFRSERRVSTLDVTARAAEYQLNEEVDFLILGADGQPLIPPATASVERVYEFNEDDILAAQNEEKLVRDSMRQDIVRQILNRLRVVPAAPEIR